MQHTVPTSLDHLATQIIDSFCGAQLQQIARIVEYPLPVYFGDRILILKNGRSLVFALSAFRAVLAHHGLSTATSKVSISSENGRESSRCGSKSRTSVSQNASLRHLK